MDFRAIRTAHHLKEFIDFVQLSDGLILADVIKTSDDYIIRVWYSLVPSTYERLSKDDCDFWFVKDNLTIVEWYVFLTVLATYADNFSDDYLYFY